MILNPPIELLELRFSPLNSRLHDHRQGNPVDLRLVVEGVLGATNIREIGIMSMEKGTTHRIRLMEVIVTKLGIRPMAVAMVEGPTGFKPMEPTPARLQQRLVT